MPCCKLRSLELVRSLPEKAHDVDGVAGPWSAIGRLVYDRRGYGTVDDLLGRLEDASDFVAERVGAIPPRAIGCARNDLQLSDHSKGGDES